MRTVSNVDTVVFFVIPNEHFLNESENFRYQINIEEPQKYSITPFGKKIKPKISLIER